MCGIIGKFGEGMTYKDLSFYWNMLNHRGTDSYGLVEYKDKRTKVTKYIIETLFERNTTMEKAEWIIAHNRWASIGGKADIKLAHPVTVNGVYIIHNGTKKSLYEAVKTAKSDTHAIGVVYNKLKNKLDIFEFLSDIGVCFIIDKSRDKILFHRDNSRTLYYSKELGMFASEPIEIGKWQMVKEQNKVLSMSEFENDWNKRVNLQNKIFELGKEVTIDVCNVCYKEKLMNEGDNKCPDCIYQNKKEETNLTYLKDSTGIYGKYYSNFY